MLMLQFTTCGGGCCDGHTRCARSVTHMGDIHSECRVPCAVFSVFAVCSVCSVRSVQCAVRSHALHAHMFNLEAAIRVHEDDGLSWSVQEVA